MPKVRVTPKNDGAVISIKGYDIEVTIKTREQQSNTSTTSMGIEIKTRPPEITALSPTPTIDQIKMDLTEYLGDLDIYEVDDNIVVKPRRFLGRKEFTVVSNRITSMGGRYVSAGRNSRFIIMKNTQASR